MFIKAVIESPKITVSGWLEAACFTSLSCIVVHHLSVRPVATIDSGSFACQSPVVLAEPGLAKSDLSEADLAEPDATSSAIAVVGDQAKSRDTARAKASGRQMSFWHDSVLPSN